MRTMIESDGEDFFALIPAEIMDQVGFGPDQHLEITVSESTIFLAAVIEDPSDSHLKRLISLVNTEALELFEGDVLAKNRWMTVPQAPLSGRKPSEMLRSEPDIEALTLLIGRLEHGSIP